MTADLGKLTRDAAAAQAALRAAQAEQAAISATRAAQHAARRVEWAYATIAAYRDRQAVAGVAVADALRAFSAAVFDDFGQAPALYVAIIRAMVAANALGVELVTARNILRDGGILPRIDRQGRDPVGDAAPFPLAGLSKFPSFADLVASTIDAARKAAARTPPATADPGSFEGPASEAIRHAALAAEWTLDPAMETLVALCDQHPDLYADRLPADQRAQAEAYRATREAAGYDAPLRTVELPLGWRYPPVPTPSARQEEEARRNRG